MKHLHQGKYEGSRASLQSFPVAKINPSCNFRGGIFCHLGKSKRRFFLESNGDSRASASIAVPSPQKMWPK